jgi:hypothetical protein
MADHEAKDRALDELLRRLETRDDAEVSRSSYLGRALSKSGKDLRLSTERGVIAIPLADIAQVTRVSNGDPTLVSVEVNTAANVTQVVEADGLGVDSVVSAVRAVKSNLIARGPIILTGDTDTITAGRPDACDDTIVIVNW